jgi:hypothetical protein
MENDLPISNSNSDGAQAEVSQGEQSPAVSSSPEVAAVQGEPLKPKNSKIKILLVVGLVLVLGFGGYFYVTSSKETTGEVASVREDKIVVTDPGRGSETSPGTTGGVAAGESLLAVQEQKNYQKYAADRYYSDFKRVYNPEYQVSFLTATPAIDFAASEYSLDWSKEKNVFICGKGSDPTSRGCLDHPYAISSAEEYPLLELFRKDSAVGIEEAIAEVALVGVDPACKVVPGLDSVAGVKEEYVLQYVGDDTAIKAEIEETGNFSGCGVGEVYARYCGDYFSTCGIERFIFIPGESETTFAYVRPFLGDNLLFDDTLTFGDLRP